jgi:peptidyl-prolyl cis-trans isomerase A (cyclophilin A)
MTPISEEKLGLGAGLYAVLETSLGEMTLKLEEKKTPETVANFVGLATGEKEYVDPRNGDKSRAPFYDGTVFHRIIKDFMVQGGDRTGTGRGGPGYRFKDEFDPSLRHTGPGILSMANAGPGTNGSQFFITLAATPWLDNKHSVFGHLVRGEDTLKKLGAVSTGSGDRPHEEVVLKRVRIVRES